jgi:hypothetical protein
LPFPLRRSPSINPRTPDHRFHPCPPLSISSRPTRQKTPQPFHPTFPPKPRNPSARPRILQQSALMAIPEKQHFNIPTFQHSNIPNHQTVHHFLNRRVPSPSPSPRICSPPSPAPGPSKTGNLSRKHPILSTNTQSPTYSVCTVYQSQSINHGNGVGRSKNNPASHSRI